METPLSSAPSTPYDASTPGSASAGTPALSDADTRTETATTQPDARSTPGVGRLRDYVFPVYDGESRRWFLLRVTDVNEATAKQIDDGDYRALEALYGVLGEAVDATAPEAAPPPAPVEGDGGADVGESSTAKDDATKDDTTITAKTTAVTISLTTSTITATSSFPEEDITPGTFYAPLETFNLSRPAKKSAPADDTKDETPKEKEPPKEKEKEKPSVTPVSRYGLVEIARLAPHVDLVAPVWNPEERLIFKHYDTAAGLAEVWNAVQFPLHLASQSGGGGNGVVMPIKNIVTHERTRDDRSGRVVGFTVPYYPGGSLDERRRKGEVCKLEWTKGLFELVDEVNLGAGVVHGGLNAKRVFLDEDGRVVLGGWGQARKRVGGEGGKKEEMEAGLEEFSNLYQDDDGGKEEGAGGEKLETDVQAAVVLVHEMVTGDPSVAPLLTGLSRDAIVKGPWRAHPKAVLDASAEEYREAVVAWLDKREKDPRVKEDGKELGFEEKMPVPEAETVEVEEYEDPVSGDKVTKAAVSGQKFYRRDLVKQGKPMVEWVRPVTGKVEEGRRLLVTGHYARTEEEKKKNDLKRRRDGEERGRGSKRARGRGRDSSRGERGEWADRPHHGHSDGERGRRREDQPFGNYRVTRPANAYIAAWERGGHGARPPPRGRRPGRGGRDGGDRGREGRSREGTGERSGSNDSRRRGGRRQDGGSRNRGDGNLAARTGGGGE